MLGFFFFSVFWSQGSLSVKGRPWPKPQTRAPFSSFQIRDAVGRPRAAPGMLPCTLLLGREPGRVKCREAGRAGPTLPPAAPKAWEGVTFTLRLEQSLSETRAAWSIPWGKTGVPGHLGT